MNDYPTDAELRVISGWSGDDPFGWFAFIKERWWAADWGWTEFDGRDDLKRPQRVFQISTGGWSGNESIISAMQENFVLWNMAWQEHRRGGHWTFTLPYPVAAMTE